MSKTTTKTPAAPAAAQAPAAPGIAQVVTVCTVTYGANETVLPGTIITPTSAAEATELRALKAVRDLTDAEAALFANKGSAAVVETELNVEPEPIPESPGPEVTPPAEENPLG